MVIYDTVLVRMICMRCTLILLIHINMPFVYATSTHNVCKLLNADQQIQYTQTVWYGLSMNDFSHFALVFPSHSLNDIYAIKVCDEKKAIITMISIFFIAFSEFGPQID